MIPYFYSLPFVEASSVFESLHHHPYSVFLDSADRDYPGARYSFIGCFPEEIIEYKNGETTITNYREQIRTTESPFDLVWERLRHYVPQSKRELYQVNEQSLPPFTGGAIGLFGYDLGRVLEDLPTHTPKNPVMPDMAIGIYTQVLAFDHEKKKVWMIIHAKTEDEAEKRRDILMNMVSSDPFEGEGKNENSHYSGGTTELMWESLDTRESYKDKVTRVVDYIKAGDVFQVNIAQRFEAALPDGFCPFVHYQHLRQINPAPYATYMNLGDIKISSSSPEQFLHIKNGLITTRPIKGTRPRVLDDALNTLYKNALQNSDKDKAENTMIVDLLRNDLSKVCLPDSVDVPALHTLESFAGVHHLVSTVHGALIPGYTALDALKACFPGGSVTGAPKVRAMEIIDELEPKRRGPYCGSVAYIGFDGAVDSNILIRTLVYEGDKVSVSVGGGVTSESKPDEEYQETLDKAGKIFESFGGVRKPEGAMCVNG